MVSGGLFTFILTGYGAASTVGRWVKSVWIETYLANRLGGRNVSKMRRVDRAAYQRMAMTDAMQVMTLAASAVTPSNPCLRFCW